MHLNPEQRQAIELGQAVPVFVDQTECVVIRRDVYERGHDTFKPEESYAAVEAVLDQEEDPGLESYQHYKR